MVTVNLVSKRKGEIKKFLDKYFKYDTKIDDDVSEWIYIHNDAKEAIKIIEAFTGESSKYKISLWVQVGDDDLIAVEGHNKNLIINKISE